MARGRQRRFYLKNEKLIFQLTILDSPLFFFRTTATTIIISFTWLTTSFWWFIMVIILINSGIMLLDDELRFKAFLRLVKEHIFGYLVMFTVGLVWFKIFWWFLMLWFASAIWNSIIGSIHWSFAFQIVLDLLSTYPTSLMWAFLSTLCLNKVEQLFAKKEKKNCYKCYEKNFLSFLFFSYVIKIGIWNHKFLLRKIELLMNLLGSEVLAAFL